MLNLTSHERKTVVFVLVLLVLGMGLDYFKKKTNRGSLVDFQSLEGQIIKRVNINKASPSELTTIPGIGENLAKAIVDYRKSNKSFKDIQELKNIKGIKDRKLEQMKKYITINAASK